jgi:tetraprenyl-beta-curcumene synthase
MRRASERIARYQSLNHGDAYGSYEPFERWAREATSPHTGLRFWETAAAAGSTLAVLALIASAADPTLRSTQASEIESAYFPWIGSLHSLLDSLVDRDQDMALEGRALMGYYSSPLDAASRMRAIAHEALQRARALPRGRHHVLITAAMTSFYISEIHSSPSPDAQIVGPSVLEALGGLSGPTMAILKARRNVGRVLGPSQAPTATPRLESQVPDFPLFIAPPDSEHTLVTSPMPIRSRAPRGGLAGPPTGAE